MPAQAPRLSPSTRDCRGYQILGARLLEPLASQDGQCAGRSSECWSQPCIETHTLVRKRITDGADSWHHDGYETSSERDISLMSEAW